MDFEFWVGRWEDEKEGKGSPQRSQRSLRARKGFRVLKRISNIQHECPMSKFEDEDEDEKEI
ncbi:MAG: hypothetical protein GX608_10520 [Lentisphaerae bacterium]|nr:hypothetical protein [Lentisphaerota bacterium]